MGGAGDEALPRQRLGLRQERQGRRLDHETEPAADRTPVVAFASLYKLWRLTVPMLDRVRAPILLYRSRVDHVVEPLSAELLKAGAVNTSLREIVLENSYHVATMDNDAPQIFGGSIEFLRSLAGEPRTHAGNA